MKLVGAYRRFAKLPKGRGILSPASLALGACLIALPGGALADITNTVTATGSFGGSPVTANASESVAVEAAAPVLAVEKSGTLNDDDGISGQSAGDTIDWAITVRNDGNVTITTITVSDTLGTPVCTTSGDDTVATLAPGASETCSVSYTLTQSDFDSDGGGDGDIDNTASASGTASGSPVTGSGSASVPITVAPSVSLTKLADDDTLVAAGQVITYTYTITNTGNQTLIDLTLGDTHNGTGPAPVPDVESATVTDNGPAGDTTNTITGDGNWDALGPGDVLTVTATYTVTQEDVETLQ
ncbi:MAG: hypothetical protein KDJ63_06310 [Nitratireductor sp.]|nr:hypothetical protein [Nitratireductor sp.]